MNDRSTPAAAVIIPHFEDIVRLSRCLDALMCDAAIEQVEVVVVDNGSVGDVDAVVGAHPHVRLVRESERGAAAARNRGVAETVAPRLFFLDCDCIPESGWIDAGLEALHTADIVGGAIVLFDETPPPRSGAEAFETVFAFHQRDYVERKGFSVSANLLTWRVLFDRIGGFINGVSEDVEWCHRAVAAGGRLVFAPDVRVRHPTRSDYHALRRKWHRTTREAFAGMRKKPFGRLRWAFLAAAVLVSVIIHAPRVIMHSGLRSTKERVRALATLAAIRTERTMWMLGQALMPSEAST